jgi:hypothetical protein
MTPDRHKKRIRKPPKGRFHHEEHEEHEGVTLNAAPQNKKKHEYFTTENFYM